MSIVKAWGTTSPNAPLAPLTITRRTPGPRDVVIDILFCGVCHSDIHQARDEWGGSTYPMVPGHEIVGRVAAVGAEVTKLAVGALAGVGCLVDSCRRCGPCEDHLEQFCTAGPAMTYNGAELDGVTPTQGGYSARIVVPEHFALRVPEGLDPAAVAPLLCAGVTTWSPLRRFGVKAGDRVGVIGLGGLGHMGVKFAASFGAHVTVFSTSAAKEADARRLGASDFVVGTEALAQLAGRFDLLLDTVSADHDYGPWLELLRPRGVMALVGAPPNPSRLNAFSLILGDRTLAGSLIGGIEETQRMLDYCGDHGIVSDIERVPVEQVNEAWERVLKSDVRYRFVLDLASLRGA
jgi:uncharacterized zinc-type alcohol dehydrogenase-like protein